MATLGITDTSKRGEGSGHNLRKRPKETTFLVFLSQAQRKRIRKSKFFISRITLLGLQSGSTCKSTDFKDFFQAISRTVIVISLMFILVKLDFVTPETTLDADSR